MTSCIILAAGSSQRFGSSKMLHSLANGQTILSSSIGLYRQVFERVHVVVRPVDIEIERLALNTGATVIAAPNAGLGMSQSLIAGVTACLESERWLIALADMPYVSPATLKLMLKSEHDIVAPCYAGRIGNPVIFSSMFKQRLLGLHGDRGGRSIIESNKQSLDLIDVDDPGVLQDIDVLGDVM